MTEARPPKRVNIVGAGKVGRSFLRLLAGNRRHAAGDVVAGSPSSARQAVAETGAGTAVADLARARPADIWVLSVPDSRIADVAAALAQAGAPPAVAIHCSGFHSSDSLAPLRSQRWAVASCHPVRSFADPVAAARDFAGTPCGIEGDPAAAEAAARLMADFGGAPFSLRTEDKAIYHAAAVFSNNFTVVLQALALESWARAGVAPDVAESLCAALLRGTADNVAALGPAAALTGPAARGDLDVIEAQARAIAAWHPDAADLYRRMSDLAQRLKQTGTTLPETG